MSGSKTASAVFGAVVLTIFMLTGIAANAQIRTERVTFAPGTSGSVVNDRLRGEEIVDYVLGVSAGQRMVVDMSTSNPSAYFNVSGPGSNAAVHVGSSDGLHFDGILPTGGDWVIRVFLMRNAARRGETAEITLSVHVGGAVHMPSDADFADSEAGGPDFWQVTGASTLNVRRGPGVGNAVIARVYEGQTVRNLGCRGGGGDRRCHIASPNGLINGWVAGRFLTEGGAPGDIATAPREPEFEVDAMGPDFWEVAGVPEGDRLNIRSGPSTRYTTVASARNGALFRNLGCRGLGASRWCHVQTAEGKYDGWVSGAFLGEGASPQSNGTAITLPSGNGIGPDIHFRATGEIEVLWNSGCVVLFNPQGQRINAGSSCSDAQLIASDLTVERFR